MLVAADRLSGNDCTLKETFSRFMVVTQETTMKSNVVCSAFENALGIEFLSV